MTKIIAGLVPASPSICKSIFTRKPLSLIRISCLLFGRPRYKTGDNGDPTDTFTRQGMMDSYIALLIIGFLLLDILKKILSLTGIIWNLDYSKSCNIIKPQSRENFHTLFFSIVFFNRNGRTCPAKPFAGRDTQ